jgi:hypothetical protein
MPVIVGREATTGVTSQERQFGALLNETRTYNKDIDDSIVLDDALDDPSSQAAATSRAQVIGRRDNGDLMVEVQQTSNAFGIGRISWNVTCMSMQERTTTDVNGDPIIVTYPPSLDWAIEITSAEGDTINSFQYTKYESQTGEAEKYIPSKEITGIRSVIVPAGGVVNHLTTVLAPWDYTINSAAFFGYAIGNVICLGVDFRPIAQRDDGSWVCEERYKFMTRPGHPLSVLGAGAGGWNTWHLWKDPNSGAIPDDVWDKKADGAVVEAQHYATKDFTVLYQYS